MSKSQVNQLWSKAKDKVTEVERHIESRYRDIIKKGQPVPLAVGTVYLQMLQGVSDSFRGFNTDELDLLQEVGTMVSFPPGTYIIKQWDVWCCAMLLVQGQAVTIQEQSHGDDITVEVKPGSYIGAGMYFENPRPGELFREPASVKLTARHNMMLLLPAKQLQHLNRHNPHAGHKMLRLLGEAVSEMCSVVVTAPTLPESAPLSSAQEMRNMLHNLPRDSTVLATLSQEHMEKVLEFGGELRFKGGEQVLHAGSPCSVVLVLVQGGLERPGECGHAFANPGHVMADALLPFRIHTHDAFAAFTTVFFTLTPENLYELNKHDSELGFKLIRDLVSSALMGCTQGTAIGDRPPPVDYTGQQVTLRDMQAEREELRKVSREGLQRLIRVGERLLAECNEGKQDSHKIQEEKTPGEDDAPEQDAKEEPLLEGADALRHLTDIFEKIQHRLRIGPGNLPTAVKFRDDRIGSLERTVKKLESRIAARDAECRDLEGALAHQCQRMQELEAQLKKQVKESAEEWDKVITRVESIHQTEGIPDESKLRDVMITLRKEQQRHFSQSSEDPTECSTVGGDGGGGGEAPAAAGPLGSLGMEARSLVPRLREQIARAKQDRVAHRWMSMTASLCHRRVSRSVVWDLLVELKFLRGQVVRARRLGPKSKLMPDPQEELSKDLSKEEELLGKMQTILPDTGLGKDGGTVGNHDYKLLQVKIHRVENELEESRKDYNKVKREMEREHMGMILGTEDMNQMAGLCTFLLMHVLSLEVCMAAAPEPILWTAKEVKLLRCTWMVLQRRNYLTSALTKLDMDCISELLEQRGAALMEEVKHPRKKGSYNRQTDGLAEQLAPLVELKLWLKDAMMSLLHPLGVPDHDAAESKVILPVPQSERGAFLPELTSPPPSTSRPNTTAATQRPQKRINRQSTQRKLILTDEKEPGGISQSPREGGELFLDRQRSDSPSPIHRLKNTLVRSNSSPHLDTIGSKVAVNINEPSLIPKKSPIGKSFPGGQLGHGYSRRPSSVDKRSSSSSVKERVSVITGNHHSPPTSSPLSLVKSSDAVASKRRR